MRFTMNYPPQRSPLDEAIALFEQGRLQDCVQRCRAIDAAQPGQPKVAELAGAALLGLGDAAGALPFLERAAAVAAAPQPLVNLAAAHAGLGWFDRARAALDRARSRFPGDAGVETVRLLLDSVPFFPQIGFQGWHAPERQVYMSAAVHLQAGGTGRLRILELGSYMGSSAITWGEAVARLTRREATLTCVDAWEDAETTQYGTGTRMESSLKSGAGYRVFQHNLKFLPAQVEPVTVKSFTEPALKRLEGPYDIIYIDACHLYDEALADIRLSKALLADGGFICGDDLERQQSEVDAENARRHARSDYVLDPRTQSYFHPGVTLAVAEALGPVSAYRGFWIMQKRDGRFLPVDMKGAHGLIPRHWPEDRFGEIRSNIALDGHLARLF